MSWVKLIPPDVPADRPATDFEHRCRTDGGGSTVLARRSRRLAANDIEIVVEFLPHITRICLT
jgi:hypothetical protein